MKYIQYNNEVYNLSISNLSILLIGSVKDLNTD